GETPALQPHSRCRHSSPWDRPEKPYLTGCDAIGDRARPMVATEAATAPAGGRLPDGPPRRRLCRHCLPAPHRVNNRPTFLPVPDMAAQHLHPMSRQFIYHMHGLSKAYNNIEVHDSITLSFYPDAKIGLLAPNGAGTSTLLRIMAGLDKEYQGEEWAAEGA